MIIRSKHLYYCMLLITVLYICYVTFTNLIYDPQATQFLSNKIISRTINVPVWLQVMYVHLVFACIAMITGAINFSNRVLNDYRKLHRINGYIYVLSVLVVVLTSGYMAPYSTGGKINSIAFNLVNIIWPWMTIAALVKIKKGEVNSHRKWMVRSYAFLFINMFIHLITSVMHKGIGLQYELAYTLGVYGSICLALVLAELVIRYVYKLPAKVKTNKGKGKWRTSSPM